MTSKRKPPTPTEAPGRGVRLRLSGSELVLAEALLEKGPMGKWRLHREMEISTAYAEHLRKSMLDQGALKRVGGGNYDLVPSVRKALEATPERGARTTGHLCPSRSSLVVQL